MTDYKRIINKLSKVAFLPQYINSDLMIERFLNGIILKQGEVERAKNIKGQIKLIEESEVKCDNIEFFLNSKEKFENEFFDELSERITEEKAKLFYEIITQSWYDGRTKRNSQSVIELMASIQNYLIGYRKVNNANGIRVLYQIHSEIRPNFEDYEIEEIISLNREMFDGYIHQWIKGHPFCNNTEDLYCRRGVFLNNLFDSEEYYEWSFINSYSIACTVTEKFAQMKEDGIPAIIHTNISNLRHRILFFSPFIKGMPARQFELGIIPHWWTQRIVYQGEHGGIHEYLID